MLAFDATAFQPEYYHGGVSLYMREVLDGLHGRGFKLPAAIDRRLDPQAKEWANKIGIGWEPTSHRGVLWRDRICRELKQKGYSRIWYPTQFTAWFPALPAISTVHDLAGISPTLRGSWRARAYMNLSLRTMLARSRRLIAISESTAADLKRHFPDAARKAIVARHGVPSDVLGTSATLLGESTKSPGAEIRYLFLDGSNERKRLDLCWTALERLGHKGRSLVVTGNQETARARLHGADTSRVRFVGKLPRPELLRLIREVDIVLYVSDFEGFGFPILEALPMETTVISFPGSAEMEVGGDCIVTCRDRSVEAITRAMSEAEERCHDRAWQQRIRKHALDFTWDESLDQHQKIFGEAL